MSVEFLATTLIVVATPGTGVIYTLTAGLSRGARPSLIALIGCTLDIIPHIVAAMTGLAALLNAIVRMLGPSSVFMLVTFLVFVLDGVFAAAVRNHVVYRARVTTWMRRTFAAAFVALDARLAVPDR